MTLSLRTIRDFAHRHDELSVYHGAQIALVLLAAFYLNLGAFVLLVVAHMALDYVKYRERHGCSFWMTAQGMLHESLVDIALLLVTLTYSVYFHHSVSLIAVGTIVHVEVALAKSVTQLAPKFVILERFLLLLPALSTYMEHLHPGVHRGWRVIDACMLIACVASVVLLVAAAPLLNVQSSVIWWVVWNELVFW